jgi:hypothetical protein
MGGCNCKGGRKQITNNLDSPDHIQVGKNVFDSIISKKTIEDLNDLDKIEIMSAYGTLYPNSSATPSVEDAVNQIKTAIELFDVKYTRRR